MDFLYVCDNAAYGATAVDGRYAGALGSDGLSGFVPQPTRREWSVVLWGGFARLGVWDAGAVLEATEGVGLMPKRV